MSLIALLLHVAFEWAKHSPYIMRLYEQSKALELYANMVHGRVGEIFCKNNGQDLSFQME